MEEAIRFLQARYLGLKASGDARADGVEHAIELLKGEL